MPRIALFFLSATLAFGQLPATVPEPTNVSFSEGPIGQMPPGWDMPKQVLDAGYRTELRDRGCGFSFARCVAYVTPGVVRTVRAAELTQTFPAGPYIGKSVRFRAWLRLVDRSGDGYIHIRMRVDYMNGKVDLCDSELLTVTVANWQEREVICHVAPGAASITIWTRYVPFGSAWVAQPSFEVVDDLTVASTPKAIGIPLTLLDPAMIDRTARSLEHSTPVQINFINRSSSKVDIYWIDYEGNRRLYRPDLAVGATWTVGTYITHPWLVIASGSGGTTKRATGLRLAGFVASVPPGGDALITDTH